TSRAGEGTGSRQHRCPHASSSAGASLDEDGAVFERVKSGGPAGVCVVTGAGQSRVLEMSAGQVGPCQVGPCQVGAGQIGGLKFQDPQRAIPRQVKGTSFPVIQRDVGKVCASQIGTPQVSTV